jgi:LPXTG-motif cell wall-anchored protein
MKKLIFAVIATAFLAIGHAPANAQGLPVECQSGEFDGTEQECIDFYTEVVVAPPTTVAATTTVPVTVPAGELPRTGSGVSPILGIGALLFVGGGIVVVASRRRTGSASA